MQRTTLGNERRGGGKNGGEQKGMKHKHLWFVGVLA